MNGRVALSVLLCMSAAGRAWAVDTYDAASGVLSIQAVQALGRVYTGVRVKVDALVELAPDERQTTVLDRYDEASGRLRIASVVVDGIRHSNVTIRIGQVLCVGCASPPLVYACDKAAALARAPRTSPFESRFESYASAARTTYERWPLRIDGVDHELNVAISSPAPGIPIQGVVVTGHGHSADNANAPPSSMVDAFFGSHLTSRGYLVVDVARRGNFGSTGDTGEAYRATVPAGAPFAEWLYYANRYQAASLVAALERMDGDPRFRPHLSTLMLIGASGGSETVVHAAFDSTVFRRASKKALVRLSGYNTLTQGSASDENFEMMARGYNEYAAAVARDTTGSLWVGGMDDTITDIGKLACEFESFDLASGFPNTFRAVPGLGHFALGLGAMFSTVLAPITKRHLAERGFPGF